MKQFALLLAALLVLAGCRKDGADDRDFLLDQQLETALNDASNGNGRDFYRLPASNDYSNIPQDPNNPITQKKVALGELLFHETGLAKDAMLDEGMNTFSCASCHFASAGFQAGRVQGIGDGGLGFGLNGEGRIKNPNYKAEDMDVQPIRSPSAMNGAYQTNMLWNGQFGATGVNEGTEALWPDETPIAKNRLGFEGLETQAIAGLTVHRMDDIKDFITNSDYKSMFDEVFGESPEAERYDVKHAGLAIAAYERTLLSNKAPFQMWLNGNETALTDDEKRGALLFFGKANCSNCHNGPALSAMSFEAIGMKDLHMIAETTFGTGPEQGANLGRGGFTKNAADNYKFKVPQLYNLADSPFYGHGSSFRTIREVIEYKNKAIAENSNVPTSQLSDEFVPLNLSKQEIDQLTAFLQTGLRDPGLKRYQPDALLSGNCTPNNDYMAKGDLGCN
ncbi:MAG: cytochrome c peroxidase [Bacteroidota bacterium]